MQRSNAGTIAGQNRSWNNIGHGHGRYIMSRHNVTQPNLCARRQIRGVTKNSGICDSCRKSCLRCVPQTLPADVVVHLPPLSVITLKYFQILKRKNK